MASQAKFFIIIIIIIIIINVLLLFSFLFISDVFMVLENHHLQLEIRLSVAFLAKSTHKGEMEQRK